MSDSFLRASWSEETDGGMKTNVTNCSRFQKNEKRDDAGMKQYGIF
ncbi:hypothetical protein [Bifidobacterium sp.]